MLPLCLGRDNILENIHEIEECKQATCMRWKKFCEPPFFNTTIRQIYPKIIILDHGFVLNLHQFKRTYISFGLDLIQKYALKYIFQYHFVLLVNSI